MERHVALAERFAFRRRPDWIRHNVPAAGDWAVDRSEFRGLSLQKSLYRFGRPWMTKVTNWCRETTAKPAEEPNPSERAQQPAQQQ
jgi:hypothetical protein